MMGDINITLGCEKRGKIGVKKKGPKKGTVF